MTATQRKGGGTGFEHAPSQPGAFGAGAAHLGHMGQTLIQPQMVG